MTLRIASDNPLPVRIAPPQPLAAGPVLKCMGARVDAMAFRPLREIHTMAVEIATCEGPKQYYGPEYARLRGEAIATLRWIHARRAALRAWSIRRDLPGGDAA